MKGIVEVPHCIASHRVRFIISNIQNDFLCEDNRFSAYSCMTATVQSFTVHTGRLTCHAPEGTWESIHR